MLRVAQLGMYLPRYHEEHRTAVLHRAMREAGVAELVTWNGSEVEASTVPLLLDPHRGGLGTLRGHLARANTQWRHLAPGVDALAIFRGPDSYVSPSFYASKAETGEVVPTWNYVVVHARGPLVVHDDAEWAGRLVRDLTDHHESGRAVPWSVDDAPEAYVARQLRAVVGIELRITRLEGKWKLSQNRPEADRAGVVAGLAAAGPRGQSVAAAMADVAIED